MTASFQLIRIFMVIFLDNYILASYFLLFYKMSDFTKQMMWKNGNLRMFRFYKITHETVVQPATDVSVLRERSILYFRVVTLLFPRIYLYNRL